MNKVEMEDALSPIKEDLFALGIALYHIENKEDSIRVIGVVYEKMRCDMEELENIIE